MGDWLADIVAERERAEYSFPSEKMKKTWKLLLPGEDK